MLILWKDLYTDHKRDAARAEDALTLSYGSELIGMQRDWNEELQSCREFPHTTLQERYYILPFCFVFYAYWILFSIFWWQLSLFCEEDCLLDLGSLVIYILIFYCLIMLQLADNYCFTYLVSFFQDFAWSCSI